MIKNIIKNCILLILSIVISLSFIEIFLSSLKLYQVDLRRHENKNILYNHIQKKNLSFDKRTLFEVYGDFKEKENYFPKVPPSIQFESLLTFGNISNSKIIGCNENGKYTLWKSDRYGFRNTDELWDEKNLDIILFGDSFTNGACVESDENISGNLIKNHSKKIINFGISGTGPLDQYAILKEYTKNLNSKYLVIIFYEGNDYRSLNLTKKMQPILYKYLENDEFSQNLIFKQTIVDENLKKLINRKEIEAEKNDYKKDEFKSNIFEYLSFSNFYKFHNIRSLAAGLILSKFEPIAELRLFSNNKIKNNNFSKIIDKFKEFGENKNSELILVYMPSVERYGKEYNKVSRIRLNKLDYIHKSITEIFEDKNIRYIDLKKDLFDKKVPQDYLFPLELSGYGHLSKRGYFEVSEVIYNFLYEKK